MQAIMLLFLHILIAIFLLLSLFTVENPPIWFLATIGVGFLAVSMFLILFITEFVLDSRSKK